MWEAQPTATFWAGARFYDRQDVHINDFYYRDPSGFGGGVEDVALGERAKLAVAWIGGTQDELESSGVPASDRFRFNKNTVDVKLCGFGLGRTRASVAVDLSRFAGDEDKSGEQPITIGDSFGASTTGILELPFTGRPQQARAAVCGKARRTTSDPSCRSRWAGRSNPASTSTSMISGSSAS